MSEFEIAALKKIVKYVAMGLVALFLLITFIKGIRVVQPGFEGVSVRLGKAQDTSLSEGVHLVIPWITTVYQVDTRIQKIEASSFEAASRDLQSVRASIVVNYNLKKEGVVNLYREIGIRYAEIVILPGVSEVYKATTANFSAEELITKRQTVSEQIKTILAERLEPLGIIVNQVNVVNFDFSNEFNSAIEAKMVAEQAAFKAEREVERIKFEAMQTKEKAEGEANAVRERAKGQADSILAIAQAEAEAMELKLQFAKPEIIMLNFVEKWKGDVPSTLLLGSDAVMPIFDVSK